MKIDYIELELQKNKLDKKIAISEQCRQEQLNWLHKHLPEEKVLEFRALNEKHLFKIQSLTF